MCDACERRPGGHGCAARCPASPQARECKAACRRQTGFCAGVQRSVHRGASEGRLLQTARRSGAAIAHAEQGLVQLAQERGAVAVLERLDERPPGRIGHVPRCTALAAASCRQLRVQRGRARRARVSSRTAARSGHVSPSSATNAGAQLLGAERLVLEERQLPAVERLGERAVGVGEAEPHEQLAGERTAERVEPRRLARAAASRRSEAPAGCRTAVRRASRRGRARPTSGAAVASRIALTASAISAGASGGSSPPRAPRAARARSSGRSRGRSPAARSEPASGQWRASSPSATARTRSPGASSSCVATEMPTSGATAAYVRRSPKSERSSSA